MSYGGTLGQFPTVVPCSRDQTSPAEPRRRQPIVGWSGSKRAAHRQVVRWVHVARRQRRVRWSHLVGNILTRLQETAHVHTQLSLRPRQMRTRKLVQLRCQLRNLLLQQLQVLLLPQPALPRRLTVASEAATVTQPPCCQPHDHRATASTGAQCCEASTHRLARLSCSESPALAAVLPRDRPFVLALVVVAVDVALVRVVCQQRCIRRGEVRRDETPNAQRKQPTTKKRADH